MLCDVRLTAAQKLLNSGKTQEYAARAIAKLTSQHAASQMEVCKLGGIAMLLALLSGASSGTARACGHMCNAQS